NGIPAVCNPDPQAIACVRPYHDPNPVNVGGPHSDAAAARDINGGRMDGFVASAEQGIHRYCAAHWFDPTCTVSKDRHSDVMGYHDGRDIPNYWTYAHDFVLQDHMFEATRSWSL